MTVYLTEKAALKLRTILRQNDNPKTPEKGIRVSAINGGCNGFEYALNIVDRAEEDDLAYEQDSVKIYLDRASAPVLDGVVIDFLEGLIDSGFKFENPNAAEACSCGKSFSVPNGTPQAVPCS
jgi:iron-sulfur cluster assembly protein